MSSPLIKRILSRILLSLLQTDRLLLTEGTTPQMLAESLGETLSGASGFAQFGPWLSGALLASDAVEELYATDEELSALLREVEP